MENSLKIEQILLFLLKQSGGLTQQELKQLLFVVEREALRQHGYPLIEDLSAAVARLDNEQLDELSVAELELMQSVVQDGEWRTGTLPDSLDFVTIAQSAGYSDKAFADLKAEMEFEEAAKLYLQKNDLLLNRIAQSPKTKGKIKWKGRQVGKT